MKKSPDIDLPFLEDKGCKQGGTSCLECRFSICKYDTARFAGRLKVSEARAVERKTRKQLKNLKRPSALVKPYRPPTFAVPGR